MAKKTTNVGLVKAIFVSTTAPSNTSVIWYDSINNIHKSYNPSTNQWEPLVEMVLIDNTTIKKDGDGKLYVDATVLPGYVLGNGSVTLIKMANVASGTVFYRKTAGSGPPEVQTLAQLKTDLGLTGTNSGDQNLSLYALKSYKINNKLLNGNITLNASDVGAPSGSGTSSGTNTGDQDAAHVSIEDIDELFDSEDVEGALKEVKTIVDSALKNETKIQPTWISAEYRDIEAGTADSHVLLLKALYAFTITSCVLKLDEGTLEISFLKNGTEITGISAISATTTKTETVATGNNTVAIGDELAINWSSTHTGNPSAIIIQLNIEVVKETIVGDTFPLPLPFRLAH